jgi:hypothetical protein
MSDRKSLWYVVIVFVVFFANHQRGYSAQRFDREQMVIDLAGQWDFRLDPEGVGEDQKWFEQGLPDKINLPGSTAENGFGDDITASTKWTGGFWNSVWFTDKKYEKYRQDGNVKITFWLQPLKHYVGKAWYRKQVNIPKDFKGKRVTLLLERCHWETKVWVDGKYIGVKNSLSTPNRFELGSLKPGRHRIALCVDNTVKINVGKDAHSVSDNTQTNWNGIVGRMQLQAEDSVTIDDVQVYPDVKNKKAKVAVTVKNSSSEKIAADINLKADSFNSKTKHSVPAVTKNVTLTKPVETFEIQYPMADGCLLWDEFSPALYKLTVCVKGNSFEDIESTDFGMREIATEGTQFAINGRKMFFRGTLECCIFPLTGYPPTDVKEWERIIKVAQSYGLNHFRFHSWCPPKAAFLAADKLGFYFQIEGPFWAKVGEGGDLDKYIYAECDRILKEYGNHPSFVLMAYGNEPGGENQKEFLGKLEKYWRAKDRRHLYTSGSGWPIIPQSDYHSTANPRIQHWGAGLNSRINAKPPETMTDYRDIISKYDVPVISHEIGQWCVYPNFDEIKKYTGVLKAKNFEVYREMLEENHMLDQARYFLMASGKLQTLCYKEDIESALRTPGFGGFQLLDLHDFPGQGTALVGVVDPFWEEKDYVTAKEYRRFSCQTVPLARMTKRTWTNDEIFKADIEIAHFGPKPIPDAHPTWMVAAGSKVYASGKLDTTTIPLGNGIKLGTIEVPLKDLAQAIKLKLTVRLDSTDFENDWDFWVYPKKIEAVADGDIHITKTLDEQSLSILKSGGKVMLMPSGGTIKGDVALGFSSIFWNTAWTRGQAPHTLGILCDPKHPALAKFPTEYHSNWQWWDIVSKSQAMVLNDFPAKLRPIVQVVDDWVTNRRLGLVFEAKVNGGKLLVCSIDLRSDLDNRPVARQMLYSLKNYMNSKSFSPKHQLAVEDIKNMMRKPTNAQLLGARITYTSSEHSGYEAKNVIDNNPATMWNTSWKKPVPGYPHDLAIGLSKEVSIYGITALPRQDSNTNGQIGDYEIYIYTDGTGLSEKPVAKGTFDSSKKMKKVIFDKPATGRYLRLRAISPVNPEHPWASLAEFGILTEQREQSMIKNNSDWLDTDGNPVFAHDGGISRFADKFYWYGSNYAGNPSGLYGTQYANKNNGFNLYTSDDLYNWKYEGVVLEVPQSGWGSVGTSHRAHVIYNDKTGKYVMWFFHFPERYPDVMATVAVADKPTGPFKLLGKRKTAAPNGYAQDLNVFKDEDGKAYLVYDDGRRNIRVDLLSDDYLNSSGRTVIALKPTHEAPAMVKYKGKYIVAGSGVLGWSGTETHYAVADSPLGPYTEKRRMSEERTWDSQITDFVYLKESNVLFAMCDSWWNPDGKDLNKSRYFWLPVSFDPKTNTAKMYFRQEWNPFETAE